EQHGIRRPHSPFQFIAAMNRLPAKATEHLPRKKDGSINAYGLAIAAQHANHFDTNQLIEAMRTCLEANVKLVTTQLDHELILTEVVVKLLGNKKLSGVCIRRRGVSQERRTDLHRPFLPPRHRTDVRNIPAHACECFDGRDNPHNEKGDVHERLNYSPKKHQNSTNRRNRPKDQEE